MQHLADWTAYWAQRTPTAPAVVEPATGRRFSYRELDCRANRLAHALHAQGVKRGDRIAVLAHNRAEHFEIFFACTKLGALFAPLNWRLAAIELDAVLADAEPAALIYDANLAPVCERLATRPALLLALDAPSAGGRAYGDFVGAGSDAAPTFARGASLEEPAMICYTSGTTGRPKGALLSHRQLLFNSLSTELAIGVSQQDATLVFMPLFHTGGFNCVATPLLHHGGKVVVMPSFDAETALALSAQEHVTIQMGVPTIFELLRDTPGFAAADLSATRMILCGGAASPLPLIEAYRARGVLFRQGYGLTEVGPNCFSLTEEDAFRKAGSVGWPNFYLDAKLVRDDGSECGPGEDGELALGGPMVTLGYYNNSSATAEAFRGTPYFHTGDTFRRDEEGYHYVVGRKKEMYISGGENVYPAEVELALAEVPGVAEVCVIGIPDARWGEVGRAVIVPTRGATIEASAVIAALAGRLAKYKVPRSVVLADALPRNPGGKLLRHEVKARWGGAS